MSYKGLKKGQKRTLQKTLLGRSHWRIKEKVYDVGNNTLSCFLESIQVSNSNHERITLWFTIHFFMAHRRLIFLWNKILLYSLAVCRVGEAEEFRRHGGWVRGQGLGGLRGVGAGGRAGSTESGGLGKGKTASGGTSWSLRWGSGSLLRVPAFPMEP